MPLQVWWNVGGEHLADRRAEIAAASMPGHYQNT
jgi:hypothetical protein